MGRMLIIVGVIFVVIGGIVLLAGRSGVPLGKLPGDFTWRGKNSVVYFPLATSIVLSIVLTLVFWIVGRMHR
jgi:ribose/xylose/arabinose/galactoside ABC-type transport system permease subunit